MRPHSIPSSLIPGTAALTGGLVWVVHALLLAARPVGCVGEACFATGRQHRESEDLAWLLLVAVVLLAVHAAWVARIGGTPSRRGAVAALVLLAGGAALLVLGLVVNAVLDRDSELWWLHDSDTLGRLLPVIGMLVLGLGRLRTSPPRWIGWSLVVSALAALAVNVQDARVLLDLPLGFAGMAMGAALLLRGSHDRRLSRAGCAPPTGGHGPSRG